MKIVQHYYIFSFAFLLTVSSLSGMVMDNRYFPWMPHLYNGSDHRHGCLYAEPFFVTASDVWREKPMVSSSGQTYGFPNLQGLQSMAADNSQSTVNYQLIAQSLVNLGQSNPIPADWQFIADFAVNISGSFEGQGFSVAGYVPFCKYFGIGGSVLFLRLVTQSIITPAENVQRLINYNSPAEQEKFEQLTQAIQTATQLQGGYYMENGPGDIEVYLRGYAVDDYIWYCRKVDRSIALGLFIPTGVQATLYNMGSVPFGGNGFWGWYLAPQLEIELKEDWKVGLELRIEKRFAKTVLSRMPNVNKFIMSDEAGKSEAPLFAPMFGQAAINPGTTFAVAPYFALEHIRQGLAGMVKYTYVTHLKDHFTDMRPVQTPGANFGQMIINSPWIQEYIGLEFLYDLSFKQSWTYKPLFTLSWDIPVRFAGAKGSSKTNRIALGVIVDF